MRLKYWLRWRGVQVELEEELATHRSLTREALVRTGTPSRALDSATERAMGNETRMREEARAVWLSPWLEAFGQGLRQGARRLRRSPGFTLAAVAALALGIGANTAIFSVVEAVMLRPLPYPTANRILELGWQREGTLLPVFTMPQVQFLRIHLDSAAAIAGYRNGGVIELDHGSETDWASSEYVTSAFFRVLGIKPQLGRGFRSGDEAAGSAGAVVLSNALWRKSFSASTSALGQNIGIGGRAYTVVGVLPPRFVFLENAAEIFVGMQPGSGLDDAGLNTSLFARLKPGVTTATAQAQAASLLPSMRAHNLLPPWSQGLKVDGYQAQQTAEAGTSLWFLMAVVGLLLLIACANVAGLMLARTLAHQPELMLRRALGASSGRLFLQFLTEGMVLSALAAAAGLALAEAALRTLLAGVATGLPISGSIGIDGQVLAFTCLVAVGAGLIFAAAAAWQSRVSRLVPGRFQRRHWSRDALVTFEVALSVLLLAGAGLLVHSLMSLESQPLGFQTTGRTLFSTQLRQGADASTAAVWRFQQRVIENLRALPGVRGAAAISVAPLMGQGNLPAEPVGASELGTSVEVRMVSPDYFAIMGIPLLQGRRLQAGDTASAPLVALANAALAKLWFAKQPLGQQIRIGVIGARQWVPAAITAPRSIVGVVGDVRTQQVREPFRPTLYVPSAQMNQPHTWFEVRTSATGLNALQIRHAVESAQAGTRVADLMTAADLVGLHLAGQRFEAQVTGLFALLALALTAIGIYGLLAYAVTERRREIGIRLALGATRANVVRQVAERGLAWALGGMVLGLALAAPLSRLMTSLLFGVQPLDPASLASAATVMMAVSLVACILPAIRAANVDATETLRVE